MTDAPRPAAVPRVSARALAPARLPVWLRVLIGACCLIEVLLFVAGLFGYPAVRQATFMLVAFWSLLFWDGAGIYPGQWLVMFLTYGLLHAGPLHLGMNMISLAAVGRELSGMVGSGRMALIYLASQIGGALTFALMQPDAGPMIGASGAVFGVAGALVGHAAVTLRRRQRPTAPLVRAVGLLLALNIGLTLLMPSIAWEAHLGGALSGLLLGVAFALSTPR
ncbi:rhomboid family intramembrane serine protease [Paracoccus beibuensis]|uniref:rhomboid family intramembrane serine protease n=1 Tax=Paracoccus beibuensis TaxID=547602 RepID=UPI00223EDA45|nr:rhomboid family intramembrane serine protease [Paracoccus beibuensis]